VLFLLYSFHELSSRVLGYFVSSRIFCPSTLKDFELYQTEMSCWSQETDELKDKCYTYRNCKTCPEQAECNEKGEAACKVGLKLNDDACIEDNEAAAAAQ